MSLIALLLIASLVIAGIILFTQIKITQIKMRQSHGGASREPSIEPLRELHTVRFLHFPLHAFFKLMGLIFGVCGFCYGVFLSVMGMCGGRVTVDFFGLHLRGEEAILFAPLLCPVLALLAAALTALPAWLVTNWLIRRSKGFDLTGVIANVPRDSVDQQG